MKKKIIVLIAILITVNNMSSARAETTDIDQSYDINKTVSVLDVFEAQVKIKYKRPLIGRIEQNVLYISGRSAKLIYTMLNESRLNEKHTNVFDLGSHKIKMVDSLGWNCEYYKIVNTQLLAGFRHAKVQVKKFFRPINNEYYQCQRSLNDDFNYLKKEELAKNCHSSKGCFGLIGSISKAGILFHGKAAKYLFGKLAKESPVEFESLGKNSYLDIEVVKKNGWKCYKDVTRSTLTESDQKAIELIRKSFIFSPAIYNTHHCHRDIL
ncbi:hypothetical protein N9O57_00055 [bacterium]|nr:hypothetical protein [bacterium]